MVLAVPELHCFLLQAQAVQLLHFQLAAAVDAVAPARKLLSSSNRCVHQYFVSCVC